MSLPMSEFSAAFGRSFAIHRAINNAIKEANGSRPAISVSDVIKHVPEDGLPWATSEMLSAIERAVHDAGPITLIRERPE